MLSIIIVNYKNPPLLRLCLKSLKRELTPELDYEIIIIDSSSSIETRNVVAEDFKGVFKSIKLFPYKENTGYTRGVNEGLKKSSGDYFLILNPDIIILKGAVEKLLKYISENKNIGMIGPKLLNFDGSRQDSCFRFYTPLTVTARRISFMPFRKKIINSFLMRDKDLTKITPVDWLMGSASVVSRKAIEKIGYMNEKLFHYFSDVDWAKRFWENEYLVVYYPEAEFYHYHERESKGKFGILDPFFKKATRWHIKDGVLYFLKHGFFANSLSQNAKI